MRVHVTGYGLDKASRLSLVLAHMHRRHLRKKGIEVSYRYFPWFGDSLLDETADVTEVFGHGLEGGFNDALGVHLPSVIKGHVALWMCYSDSFADELIARGAKSVFGWDNKLQFTISDLFYILPYWDELIMSLLTENPVQSIEKFMTQVRTDERAMEVFHNAVFTYKV